MTGSPPTARRTLAFAGAVLAMLATFRLLDAAVTRLGRLAPAAYEEPFFLDDLPSRWWGLLSARVTGWLPFALLALFVAAAAADQRLSQGAGRRRLRTLLAGWDELEEGRALRWLVVAVTGIAAWTLSCYPRNLYFDQLHLADRAIVVALWAAVVWRPILVFPFAIAAAAVAGQFTVPLGFISWTEMGVVLRFPLLFGAFWLVRAVTGERRSDAFLFAWCCLLAATYWTSGLGKVRIDWLSHPHVHLLLVGAHANGWLAFVDTEVVGRVAQVIARAARPLMLFTLLVECGAILLLARRWSLVAFLGLAAAFHLGAFALTGIFFWKWITIDALLLAYLLRGRRLARVTIFTPARFALSVAVILANPLWVKAEDLTWFDTPLTYSLRFEGVDARGAVHLLPAGFFRPYTEAVVLGTFAAVSPYAQLTRGMGVTMDRRLAEALEAARSPDELFAIERSRGRVRHDPAASLAFDDFVARHAANVRCPAEREPLALRLAGPPRHLWTFPLDAALPCGISLVKVRVLELTTFHDGTSARLVRTRVLREVASAPVLGAIGR